MCELFDEPAIDRWTPIESPFDLAAARRYLARARSAQSDGTGVHLAVTTDGVLALGEVILFARPAAGRRTAEIGYTVGAAYRGQGLATRAVRVLVEHAVLAHGLQRFVLRIEPGNAASEGVARASGFTLSALPPQVQESKGRRVELATWELDVGSTPSRPAASLLRTWEAGDRADRAEPDTGGATVGSCAGCGHRPSSSRPS
jgi:RimJ/RimL family protein N-acetyltransferase